MRVNVPALVRELVADALALDGVSTVEDLNSGSCVWFANELHEALVYAGEDRALIVSDDWFCDGPDGFTPDGVPIGHTWVWVDGRHYDAETPEGVEDWEQLPFFRRWRESSESPWRPRRTNAAAEQGILRRAAAMFAKTRAAIAEEVNQRQP